jgi:hypothetical protein
MGKVAEGIDKENTSTIPRKLQRILAKCKGDYFHNSGKVAEAIGKVHASTILQRKIKLQ